MMRKKRWNLDWPGKETRIIFFFINSDSFSKNQFYGNYCLIYKHQFQLHHHDTWAWWEKMTNYSAGQSFLLKGNPPKNVNTSGHVSKHLSEKLHIWKNVKIHLDNFFFFFLTTSVTPTQEKYSWKLLKGCILLRRAKHEKSVVDTGESQPLKFSI